METNAHHASKRRTLIGLSGLALGTSTLWSNLALSQTKVVRFILPVATASGVDTITRASSQALSAALVLAPWPQQAIYFSGVGRLDDPDCH